MARTKQRARCSHSGPPCHQCVIRMLQAHAERRGKDTFEDAAVTRLIALQAQGMPYTNAPERGDRMYDRLSNAIMYQVADAMEAVYSAALKRGAAEPAAARRALQRARVLGPQARRAAAKRRSIDSLPANHGRIVRRRLLAERRAAGDCTARVVGGPAAGADAGVQAVLARLRSQGLPAAAEVARDLEEACARLAPGVQYEVLAHAQARASGDQVATAVIRNSERRAVWSVVFERGARGGSCKSTGVLQ